MKNIYVTLLGLLAQKKPLALATIIETRGSTPQVSGASAVFSEAGLLFGTLGGGLLEADAQNKSLTALKDKANLVYDFTLAGEFSQEEEAVCGGSVTVFIEESPQKHLLTFEALKKSLLERQKGALVTCIEDSSSKKISVVREWIREGAKHVFEGEVKKVLEQGRPLLMRVKERLVFIEPSMPLPRLVIAGAGHIGQAVAHLGSLLDFEVTVVDERADFANAKRFPEADRIVVEDIGHALAHFPIGPDTFIVIVTRGHSRDAEALRACIHSEAAYIGVIGSGRKIGLMREEFLRKGWATEEELGRVYAPIGLKIGSKTVEEIGVSIAAQLVLVRSQTRMGQRREEKR